jgi:enterochelin esterase-like enzyme
MIKDTLLKVGKELGLIANYKVTVHRYNNYSPKLARNVLVDVYLPKDFYYRPYARYSILFINDGQDMAAMNMLSTLEQLMESGAIGRTLVVAIHTNENRIQEYGVASQADYKNRGSLAGNYAKFIIEELYLFIRDHYRLSRRKDVVAFAGMSLGGLSAFDIAWHHAHLFSRIGVFSGSFWWRSKPMDEHAPDANRIMHDILHRSFKQDGMRFWLQTGTKDEEEDRNKNGVIDAIDDTLDIIN